MPEKTRYVFERSKIQPNLEDVELEVELTPDELNTILRAREIHDDPQVRDEAMRGSGHIRQYYVNHSPPYGYGLAVPRDELLGKLRGTTEYIEENNDAIVRESPLVAKRLKELSSELRKIVGEKED